MSFTPIVSLVLTGAFLNAVLCAIGAGLSALPLRRRLMGAQWHESTLKEDLCIAAGSAASSAATHAGNQVTEAQDRIHPGAFRLNRTDSSVLSSLPPCDPAHA